MEQHFFEDEFEQFLRETTDNHKMYPSDGVWTRIYRHLHTGRRRIAIGGLLLLFLTGALLLVNTRSPLELSKSMTAGGDQAQKDNGTLLPDHSDATSHHSLTVDDIIAKLRASSLVPPVKLEAPMALAPLDLGKAHEPFPGENQLFALIGGSYQEPPVMQAPQLVQDDPVVINQTEGAKVIPLFTDDNYDPSTIQQVEPGELPSSPEISKDEAEKDLMTWGATAQVIKLSQRKPRNKLSYQMYFAPNIGYRTLAEPSQQQTGTYPLAVRYMDVNQFVSHQPAIGFELGGGVRYQASRTLAFRTGLQLNLTRYSIQAYSYYPEKTTVALTNEFGYRTDTLVSTSNIRNMGGTDLEQIQNQYLQVAIPIGAELKLFGDSKFQVNLSGALMPSYLLNTDVKMLSSDLTNYVNEPSLLRRWNLASAVEAFVSYETHGVRWQVGPQFRYNLLSSYKKQYPIKENLMEYGLKIGVSKTIR
ncbi:PorT family protein [Flavihumibacter rivuli]|uniref:outer membrane beta-barrel protein n=1 Tax=Flavihumibacter rivuli TaxID=2838156 RepID=UPI001BDEC562|nr:outer membrane beta-barrel protein [Flavihumibacter rivuli]ULQ56319.1 PorT family protein [Flavihumibacter rivuli]